MTKIIVTTSWDDGHNMDLKLAQLLKIYSLSATFYVAPQDREFAPDLMLTPPQIKIISHDFEIGAHTITHPLLSKISPNESQSEISESKKYLEKIINKPVVSFCYPSGDYTQIHLDQVKNAGFKNARTTKRFSYQLSENKFLLATSVHAYRHWSDALAIFKFAKGNPFRFFKYYFNWDQLAIAMFDQIVKKGGVFHLWGHSWEIDTHHDWQRLENVFKHISHHQNISYLTNGQLYD